LSLATEETQNELQVVLAYYLVEAGLYIKLTIYQNAQGFRLNEKLCLFIICLGDKFAYIANRI